MGGCVEGVVLGPSRGYGYHHHHGHNNGFGGPMAYNNRGILGTGGILGGNGFGHSNAMMHHGGHHGGHFGGHHGGHHGGFGHH